MSAGARGSYRERRLAEVATGLGWTVYRSAGSHGNADLVALRRGCVPLLIQVKGDLAGPFAHFGPDDRYALMAEARNAGARAFLAWHPGRKPVRWFIAPEWREHDSPLP
jgi:Holliday junction resolvase